MNTKAEDKLLEVFRQWREDVMKAEKEFYRREAANYKEYTEQLAALDEQALLAAREYLWQS